MDNINVTVRMDREKIEKLKDIAREKSYREKIHITYNDLIVASVYKEYFGKDKKGDGKK